MSRPLLSRITSRPLRRLVSTAVEQGFTLTKSRSHSFRLTCPRCSGWTSFSPYLREDDRRAHLNLRSRLRGHGLPDDGSSGPSAPCPPPPGTPAPA
ncbi:hypothetical protein [Streptomyces sp. NPDC001889]